jgi:uncharacterized protein (DUF1697 family)
MEYAVFLRAINVGRANRITMEELRALCAPLGFGKVITYLQSGNLAVEADGDAEAVAIQIEQALSARGLKNVSAMVRTRDELAEVVAACPFDRYDAALFRCYVTFLRLPAPTDVVENLAKAEAVVAARERELLTVTEIASTVPGFDVNGLLTRRAKIPSTTRYWNVAAGLLELMDRQRTD